MPNKKFILDIFLLIMLILLMYVNLTGLLIHEYLGIIFTILVSTHLVFNYRWIKSITKNFSNVKTSTKAIYIFNIIIFISYLITIITGILISKEIFFFLNTTTELATSLHYLFGYISLILTFVHTMLHYKEIRTAIEKRIDSSSNRKISYAILTIVTTCFVIVGFNKKELLATVLEKKKSNDTEIQANSDNTSSDNSKVDTTSDEPPTLYEYLKKLHCNGCSRHCFLTSLSCSRGDVYLEKAKEAYYEEYNINN